MMQSICRQIRSVSLHSNFAALAFSTPKALNSLSNNSLMIAHASKTNFSTFLSFEMRSGRVGKIKIENQKELDKILERTGSIGLVAEDTDNNEADEEVDVVVKMEDIRKGVVYQVVFPADENENYEDMEDFDQTSEEDGQEVQAKQN